MATSAEHSQPDVMATDKMDDTRLWPAILTFFVLAYALAFLPMPVLQSIAEQTELSVSELTGAVEDGAWSTLPATLTTPPFAIFLITRVQDFAFTLAGVISAFVFFARNGLNHIRVRFRLGRSSWIWYGVALIFPLLCFGIAAALAAISNPDVWDTRQLSIESLVAVTIAPASGVLFYLLLRAGLGEEPGLRGFAYSLLQRKLGPFTAAALVGVLWVGWHLPVLVTATTGTIIAFSVLTFLLSFLFAWLFNKSSEAIWVVALLHATINAGDNMFEAIFPGLQNLEWQLPGLAILALAGLVCAIALFRGGSQGAG